MSHKVYSSPHNSLRVTIFYAMMHGPKGKHVDFVNGLYATSDEYEQEAIETSESFHRGRIALMSETKDEPEAPEPVAAPKPPSIAPEPPVAPSPAVPEKTTPKKPPFGGKGKK